jgi:RNA polymerase sigma factor (sigma-70 family)
MERSASEHPDELGRRIASAADRVLLYIRVRLGPALRKKMEPEDVLQETYAAALAVLDRFEDRGDEFLVRWLCRIAETTIRSLAEREGAAKRTPPGDRERLTRILDLVRDSVTGPATAVGRSERNEKLARAMDDLPEDERRAILARFFLGRTFEEIGEEIDISTTAARRMVGRATKRLGGLLR